MEKIISEIQEGKWFVSMECLFAGFDYALTAEDGSSKLLSRDQSSAFLTKHLRAYGGSGEYENYKIGRALSNISFSGKGLVSKPANSRSVILNSKSTAQFNVTEINSNLNLGDLNMSDASLLEKQLADVQTQLSEAKSENKAIKAKIEEAKDKEFASTVEAFESEAEQSKAKIDELNEVIKSTQARVAELEDTLATSQNELSEAMKDMDAMKKKEKMEKRKASLVEAGISEDDLEDSLANFEVLEDEAFESIVALMKKKAKKDEKEAEAGMPPELKEAIEKKKKEKEAKAEDAEVEEAEAEEVTAEAFEDLESSEATLVESEEVDELEKTRASVADWFANHVLSTK